MKNSLNYKRKNNFKAIIFVIVAMAIVIHSGYAQSDPKLNMLLEKENEVEFTLPENAEGKVNLYNLGKEGFLLIYNLKNKTENADLKVGFTKFGADLKEQYTTTGKLNKDAGRPMKIAREGNYIYILYAYEYFEKYQILSVELTSGTTNLLEGRLPFEINYVDFVVKGNIAHLPGIEMASTSGMVTKTLLALVTCGCSARGGGGSFEKDLVFFTIDLKTGILKNNNWALTSKKHLYITGISAVDGLEDVNYLLKYIKSKKDRQVYLWKAKRGYYETPQPIGFEEKIQPVSMQTHFLGNKEFVGGFFKSSNTENYSDGFYFITRASNPMDKIEYVPYKKMDNYKIVIGDTANRSKDGKGEYLDWQREMKAYQHPLLKLNGSNILVTEFYYPSYKTTYAGDKIYSDFIGNKYTALVAMAFDDSGKMLWNKTVSLNEIDKYMSDKKARVAVILDKEKGNIMCSYVGKIKNTSSGQSEDMLVSVSLNEKGVSDKSVKLFAAEKGIDYSKTQPVIEPWYDKLFIAIGSKVEDGKSVVYVYKIAN